MKPEIVVTPPRAPTSPTFREYVELVREDWTTNRGQPGGFQALLAVRTGQLARSIRSPLLRKAVSLTYRLMRRRARFRFGIEVHRSMTVGRKVRIVHQGGIVFHQFTVLGDSAVIRQGVTFGMAADGWKETEHATVGRNVRIAAGAIVIGRVRIGDDAHVGPNAVVMTDLPAGAVVVAPRSRVIAALSGRDAAG